MTTCLLQVSAAGLAQKITYRKQSTSLEEFFKVIRVQTGYYVIYADNGIDDTEKIDVDFNHTELKLVLEEISKGRPFGYTIVDKNIILKKRQPNMPKIVDQAKNIFVDVDISGKIITENNTPLIGASVRFKSNGKIVKTTQKGEFYLNNVDDKDILVISFVGYKPVELGIRKTSNGFTVYTLDKSKAKALRVTRGDNINIVLKLEPEINDLHEIRVENVEKLGIKVELEHRRHQTLAQLLEGSVPGLTAQKRY